MDFERALVTKIIDDRDIRSVIKAKIDSSFFYDTGCKAAFRFLTEWYRNPTYGDTPSWPMFEDSFEGFESDEAEDSIEALCKKVRERKLYSDIAEVIQSSAEATERDSFDGFEEMKKQIARLTIMHTVNNATRLTTHLPTIKDEYIRMKNATGAEKLRGYPYPWPVLSDATLGAQGGHFIIFYGRPKTKKTWLGLACVEKWNSVGANVCCFSQELSDEEIARRYTALVCGINYRDFCRGELSHQAEKDFFDNLTLFAERPPFDIDYLEGHGEEIELEMKAKVDEMGYTAIMIDGAHKVGRDWKELGAFCTAAKRVAKEKKIPVLVTTHAHRRGGKVTVGDNADDVAHADSFFQDCDMALRILCEKEHRRAQELVCWVSAIREGEPVAFAVNAKLCEDMGQKRIISLEDDDDDEPTLPVDNTQDMAADKLANLIIASGRMKVAKDKAKANGKLTLKLRA